MPYISACLHYFFLRLLSAIIPALQKVPQRRGESGRRKITQWTRYSSWRCVWFKAWSSLPRACWAKELQRLQQAVTVEPIWFLFSAAIILTAGTTFLMWLGDQIDEFGLGNGVSLIIQIGILSRLPAAIRNQIFQRFDTSLDTVDSSKIGPSHLFILLSLFLLMVMAVVFVTQAERRIPMQTPKRSRIGFKQQHFLPLKLNASGVIAIIFAQSLIVLAGLVRELVLVVSSARSGGLPAARIVHVRDD